MSKQFIKGAIAVVGDIAGGIGCIWTGFCAVLFLALLLFIPACISNAVFGWPPLLDDDNEAFLHEQNERRNARNIKSAEEYRARIEYRRTGMLCGLIQMLDESAGKEAYRRMFSFPLEGRITLKEAIAEFKRVRGRRSLDECETIAEEDKHMKHTDAGELASLFDFLREQERPDAQPASPRSTPTM